MARTLRTLRAALALVVVATIVGAPVLAEAATTQVTPSSMGTWSSTIEDTTGAGAPVANGVFVEGPSTPPAGIGSYRQVAAQGHKQYLHTPLYAGAPVDSLDISFSTNTSDPGPSVITTALNLAVDTNGDSFMDRSLVFEPYEQQAPFPAAATGVWQDWNDVQTGRWWATGAGYGTGGPRKTLAGWNTEFGGSVVLATFVSPAAVRFVVGSSGTSWPDIETHVDNIAINGDVYDFEPEARKTVHPNQLHNWEPSVTAGDPGTIASFVLGPDAPPAGIGSLRQRVTGAGDFSRLQNSTFAGTSLVGLDLSYWTYMSANNGGQAPALKLRVDIDGNGTGDETLVFEPAWQNGALAGTPVQCSGACPQIGVWERWDAGKGAWWTIPPGGGGPPTTTLFEYAKAHPQARIAFSFGSLRIETGSSDATWVGTDGAVDRINVNGNLYDLEPMIGALDCDQTTNDIAAVQTLVDSAPDGYVLRLRGTCDFSAAAPHGGDHSSLESTAVLIRPGTPFAGGFTIESDGAPQSATIVGGGTQTAFTVAPGNDNVTIRGLRFVNFARPIVTINNSGTTIGGGPGIPSPTGNRIIGNATMREAIMGLAISANPYPAQPLGTIVLRYGAGGGQSATFTGQTSARLEDLSVEGNYISYNPPGTEDTTSQVVAVAVRQRFTNVVEGVSIERNAVGMFASEFPTTNMTGVQIHSFNSPTTTGPGDYLIRDVEIDANNLGRLDELGLAGDVHATGRTGIVLLGVSNFVITDNGVRVRVSPTGVPMPGGGIVVSDSGFGRVGPGNSSIVLTDPSVTDSDMGAYAIVEDLPTAFASGGKAQTTTDIVVTGNRIGAVGGPGIFARRGLVVTKAARVVAVDNDFEHTSEDAVNLGVAVVGPGSVTTPGPITLPKGVTDSVVCLNNLDGTDDDADEVTHDAVTSNAFPGGAGVATGNVDCTPTLSLAPSVLNTSTGDLEAAGFGWPNRPVEVELTAGATTITKSATAGPAGAFQVDFTPAEWQTLADGTITGVATSSDVPSGAASSSEEATALKDLGLPPAPAITSPLDGSVVPPSFTVTGTGPAGLTLRLNDGPTTIATTAVDGAGNWSVPLTGQLGALSLRAFAVDASDNVSPASNVVNLTIDATVPAPPVIVVPAEGEVVGTNAVTISGTAAPNHTVEVRRFSPAPGILLGSAVADGAGDWSINTTMADGVYQVRATAINPVNTPSAPAVRTFRVRTDFTPPPVPTIVTPSSGSLQPTLVTISGEAEVGSRVTVVEGASVVGRATTGANGSWRMQVLMSTGAHTVTASAEDAGGNTSPSTAARSFRVDGQRPRSTITTANMSPAVGTPVIEGTASDDHGVARVEIQILNALGTTVFSGPATLAAPNNQLTLWSVEPEGIGTGIFTIRATSVDVAGNRSGSDSIQMIVVGG